MKLFDIWYCRRKMRFLFFILEGKKLCCTIKIFLLHQESKVLQNFLELSGNVSLCSNLMIVTLEPNKKDRHFSSLTDERIMKKPEKKSRED